MNDKDIQKLVSSLEKWKAFALSMWGTMTVCNAQEKCIKKDTDPKCPCDYYNELTKQEEEDAWWFAIR